MPEDTNSPDGRQGEFPSQLEYDEYAEGRVKGLRLAFALFAREFLSEREKQHFIEGLESLSQRGFLVMARPEDEALPESLVKDRHFRGFADEILALLETLRKPHT